MRMPQLGVSLHDVVTPIDGNNIASCDTIPRGCGAASNGLSLQRLEVAYDIAES